MSVFLVPPVVTAAVAIINFPAILPINEKRELQIHVDSRKKIVMRL